MRRIESFRNINQCLGEIYNELCSPKGISLRDRVNTIYSEVDYLAEYCQVEIKPGEQWDEDFDIKPLICSIRDSVNDLSIETQIFLKRGHPIDKEAIDIAINRLNDKVTKLKILTN